MSRTVAYICDYKDHLVSSDKAVGIEKIDDLFDKLLSFPMNFNPEKCSVHICTDCYKDAVLDPASKQVNRKKDGEEAYALKIKELAYGFRSQSVRNQSIKGNVNNTKKVSSKSLQK